MSTQIIARWTDEKGDNTLSGIVLAVNPLKVISTSGSGVITVPDGADIFRPARPEMIFVSKAADYR